MPVDMWLNKDGTRSSKYGKCLRWAAQWPNPRRRNAYCTKLFGTKAAAKTHESIKIGETAKDQYVDDAAGKILITDCWDTWVSSLTLCGNSVTKYESTGKNQVKPHLGHLQVRGATTTDIRTWVKVMGEMGLSPSTIHCAYNMVAGMFKAAVDDKRRGSTPCVRIVLPDLPTKLGIDHWVPSAKQVTQLINAMPVRYRLAVYLAAGCGLRSAEIRGLCLNDTARNGLDFAAGVVHVRHQLGRSAGERSALLPPKTLLSGRAVDLPSFVADAAKRHIAAGYAHPATVFNKVKRMKGGTPYATIDTTLLFSTTSGKPVQSDEFSKAWIAAVATVDGVPFGFRLHDLRHYFVKLMIQSGSDVIAVQRALGHAKPSTTLDIYSRWFPDNTGKAKTAIEGAFAEGFAAVERDAAPDVDPLLIAA